MKNQKHITIIGTGAVATSLAYALKNRCKITLVGRNRNKLKQIAKAIKSDFCLFDEITDSIIKGTVFLAVGDSAIADVTQSLWYKFQSLEKSLFFHLSGSYSSEQLQPLKMLGASIGSFHPMQTFPKKNISGNEFNNIWIALEGDSAAIREAKKISKFLNARYFTITAEKKPLYHAAGVFASNYVVTLLAIMEETAAEAKLPKNKIKEIYAPLIFAAISNVMKTSPAEALTGPIARGDVETVTKHLRALSTKKLNHLVPLYSALGIETAKLAKKKYAR